MVEARPPFVLVHGTWHGGWCWKKVVALLEAAGHHVTASTLTGLGERAHLIGPSVGLDTHVDDMVQSLEMEDLNDVILVGHSYGGMVISGVAARVAHRIRRLVYLDAIVPQRGQSAFDIIPRFRQPFEAAAAAAGQSYTVPPMIEISGVTDLADLAWMRQRLRPHPIACFHQRLEAPEGFDLPLSTYILCNQSGIEEAEETATRCGAKGWPVLQIECGHDAMIIKPQELAALLLFPECTRREP